VEKPFDTKVAPLVRVHSECFTGEVTWSARCDCGDQLEEAARRICQEPVPHGVIIYLRQEGRGIGLEQKLKAYNLQDLGFDTVEANEILGFPADAREYDAAVEILYDLGLAGGSGIRLLTNNPEKLKAIGGSGTGIIIREVVSIASLTESFLQKEHSSDVKRYLRTKSAKMGYKLELQE
jgi:GTP cyclohydrolase II